METILFNDLLATAAAWLVTGCAAWMVLIIAAAVLECSTAGRLRATSWVGCPAPWRLTLLAGLGVMLATSQVPAGAAPRALPSPARPLGGPPVAQSRLVVGPGDVLWRLAEEQLPRSATTGQVADLVGRLHQRNRSVIGPDPDLILPGQRLVVPASPGPGLPTRDQPSPREEKP